MRGARGGQPLALSPGAVGQNTVLRVQQSEGHLIQAWAGVQAIYRQEVD